MARIRTVKPDFWTSEQIVECSPIARLLFIGLWNFCDDQGVHPASAKKIKMEVFPADDISTKDVSGFIDELVGAALLDRFEDKGKQYLWVTGWHHQKIDRPSNKYPSPNRPRTLDDGSTNDRRQIDEPSPPEGKGREGNKNSTQQQPTALNPARDRLHECQDVLLRMLENDDPAWATRDAGAVRQWLTDGADPEAHIYPTIERAIASGAARKARSMRYFTNAVMEAAANRPVNGAESEPENAQFVVDTIKRARNEGDDDDVTAILRARKAGGWDKAETVARKYLERVEAAL